MTENWICQQGSVGDLTGGVSEGKEEVFPGD